MIDIVSNKKSREGMDILISTYNRRDEVMKYDVTDSQIEWDDGVKKYKIEFNKMPEETIPLVTEAKENLLQKIECDDMLMNLNNLADLLYVAYCVLDGQRLQSNIMPLTNRLCNLYERSRITMLELKEQSEQMIYLDLTIRKT